ncbi:MAG: lipid-A-disaccharide synthase [Bacteroidota bacterium]
MKYYIIAGEASGDLHASNLMHYLNVEDDEANFRCWGGDLMQAQGGFLVKHYRDLAFMGFVEVAKNIRTILENFKLCKNDILEYKPDVLILVDYPGFNLRMAEFAKKNNIKVFYYISPQIWAWKQSRVHAIKRDVDKVFSIVPFEKDFYAKFGVEVEYNGHPLIDALKSRPKVDKSECFKALGIDATKKMVALLPGSRKQEITKILPVFVEVAKVYPDINFVIACAPSMDKSYLESFYTLKNIKCVTDQTYKLLSVSDAALVASGTATLETALLKIPQVVCYAVNSVTFWIAKKLAKVKYVSLANLIMNKEVIKELIQHDLTVEKIKIELNLLLENDARRTQLASDYNELVGVLGGEGASALNAKKMISLLKKT